ncbi:MAG TPA: D-sedoheptulose 7-phosphate isomerase [Candidatus Eisenbacteria bacterium]
MARPTRTTRRAAPGGPMERAAHAILAESGRTAGRLAAHATRAVAAAAESAVACLEAGGTLYFCGNGGSAADAQHLACELAGRYLLDRPALPAVALSTNTSALTAIGNDFGYEHVFARQLEGLGAPGDVLVAITTSGRSASILRAVDVARSLGMVVIGMTGARGRAFAARCDHALVTPHDSTPRIQEGHIAMGHALCELVERSLFARAHDGRPAGPRRRRRPRGRAR